MTGLPGGPLATRPLHFFWICDCSGSMKGNKIESLNYAIRNAIPEMQAEAMKNPNAEVLIRAIRFANGAQWHIATPVPVADFQWQDLTAEGVTDMGKALKMVGEQLQLLPERGLPPVLVLISDGQPTDNFEDGLKSLLAHPWGKKAVKMAIAIGDDADLDVLQSFMGNVEIAPLQANNSEALVRFIKWVSTVVLKSVSASSSDSVKKTSDVGNVLIPVDTIPDGSEEVAGTWDW